MRTPIVIAYEVRIRCMEDDACEQSWRELLEDIRLHLAPLAASEVLEIFADELLKRRFS